MSPIRDEIQRLLAHHESAAAALRTTLELLGSPAPVAIVTNGNGHAAIEAAELVLASTKRGRKRKPKRKNPTAPKREPAFTSQVQARREKTLQFLAQFNHDEPFKPTGLKAGSPLGPLVYRGYLRHKGDGYVRTAKSFEA